MTSLSRRNRPIIRRSIRRSNRCEPAGAARSRPLIFAAACAALILAGGSASAQEAADPLAELKNRSAAARWQRLVEQFSPREAQPEMAVPAREAEQPPRQPLDAFEAAGRALGESLPAPLAGAPEVGFPTLPSGLPLAPAPPLFEAAPQFGEGVEGSIRIAQNELERSAQPGEIIQFRPITEILPYADFEPDPEVRRDNPCLFLCPRPDDPRCQTDMSGRPQQCPPETQLKDLAGAAVWQTRQLPDSVFTWEASNLYHNPLYFQDAPLERYGHTHGHLLQPFMSTGKFGLQLVGLPYQMTIDPVCKKVYTLGWYRPGEPAPKLFYQIPWHHQAALNQATVMTGLIYLIP